MIELSKRISVLGAGSWGIAIAKLLHEKGHEVMLWEFNRDDYEYLVKNRSHNKKLPGIQIADEIKLSNDLAAAAEFGEYIVFVVPAQTVRKVCENLKTSLGGSHYYINLAKGVEVATLKRMSELFADILPDAGPENIATLSGPSHAEEVSRGVPTSVVIASENLLFAEELQKIFSADYFRVYRSSDLLGVELGGSLKNVVAIASGIMQGMGLGDNTSGALLTRGLAEITRIGEKMGADPLTFSGLSGIGDLVTTCLSRHSRNRYVGERIGKGEKLKNILDDMVMVAEGVETCRSAYTLADKYKVDMPITEEVYQVLFNDKSPQKAISDLMQRSLKEEIWS